MELRDVEEAQSAARDLAAVLAAYEEELMSMERNAPGVAPLRRALGEALAKACACAAAPLAGSEPAPVVAPRSWASWS